MYTHPPFPFSEPAPGAFPTGSNGPIIEVTGEGTVSAAPNRSIIVLGVVTQNPNLTAAQRDNSSAANQIIDALLKLNIPREQIQTTDYRIDMQYLYEDGKQIFKGYQVTHMLQITLDRIEWTGLVVDTAVNNGANSVASIQFATTHPGIYYNQALELALKDAEAKAMTIANTLGVTLIRQPYLVQELPHGREPVPYAAAFNMESKVTPIQPGLLKITASIKARYSYTY